MRASADFKNWLWATAATGAATGVLMVLLGMEPRLVLVGFVVIVSAAAAWVVGGLLDTAAPLAWHDYDALGSSSLRADRRVQILKNRLRQPTRRRSIGPDRSDPDGARPRDEIGDSLLEIIDDHLLAELGVDRTTDPAAATELLGADLARFVSDPTVRRSMTQRRTLARTIESIERLTDPSADHEPIPDPEDRP